MMPAPGYPPQNYPQPSGGNTLSTLAIIFGAVGFFFVPLLFGTVALVLAIVAKSKNESRANVGLTVAIVGLVGGLIVGAIIGSMFLL